MSIKNITFLCICQHGSIYTQKHTYVHIHQYTYVYTYVHKTQTYIYIPDMHINALIWTFLQVIGYIGAGKLVNLSGIIWFHVHIISHSFLLFFHHGNIYTSYMHMNSLIWTFSKGCLWNTRRRAGKLISGIILLHI